MANHASALKRHRQDEKIRARNKSCRSSINTSVKKVFAAIDEKDTEAAKAEFQKTIASIDSAVNKGVYKRTTASRKISRLTKKFNAAISQ